MTGQHRYVVNCPTCGVRVRLKVYRTGITKGRCPRGHRFSITVRKQ